MPVASNDLTAFVSEVRGGEFDGYEMFGVEVAGDRGRPVCRLLLTREAAGKIIALATQYLVGGQDDEGDDDDGGPDE